ncbi:MAG: pyruvate kinase [Chloroflexi bacterium]|nr:pyruvate kinase [Chloroflexota bacterium]
MSIQTSSVRHVKIVATLGPASSSGEVIEELLRSGVDIVRLNLAYGTLEEHARVIGLIRRVSQELGLPTAVLLDMPGSKRRTGDTSALFAEQLEFARAQGADIAALSFLTSAQQIAEVKALLRQMVFDIQVMAKIEQAAALEQSEEIIAASDGVMVARGDLALEISIEKVPLAQKRLIRAANRKGRPVITATEMLMSMVGSKTPTRAEATDVANAVLDGTDAVMLSEETAIGKYPVEAVRTMARIILETETALPYQQMSYERDPAMLPEINDATARAACQIASQIGAKGIIAFTEGGSTALRVSKYRPRQPILAVTPSERVMRRLSLLWGVYPVRKSVPGSLDDVFALAGEVAQERGAATRGDLIVITAGIPLAVTGSTNLVKVHVV